MARHLIGSLALLPVLAACGESTESETSIAGTWQATTLRVTQSGQAPADILPQGASLSITINADNSTSGTLVLPASFTGGAALNASMAGTAVLNGVTVMFSQAADTFVRELTFTLSGTMLSASDQMAGGDTWTVVLTRQ
jgi:hypothetical protein